MLNKNLLLLIILYTGVAFAGDPSLVDLPATKCRDAWKSIINKGKHNFKKSHSNNTDQNGINLEYQDYLKDLKRYDCKKDWTILVYMQADNDLRPYAFWDLAEMESTFSKRANGSTLKTDVIVHLDTDLDRKLRRYHMFQSKNVLSPDKGKELYETWNNQNIASPIIQEFDEDLVSKNKSQDQVFKEFIEWGMANYPAEHYMVIIWGHGQGWSQSSAVQFGGIATDDTDNQRISVTQIKDSLQSIRKTSMTGEKLDILVTDACLMQTVEVASELGAETRYVVGSTQIQNFMGLPYRRMLYELNAGDWLGTKKDPSFFDDVHRMAYFLPELVSESFKPRSGGHGFHQGNFDPKAWDLFTISSVNAEELNNQGVIAFSRLSDAIIASMKEDDFIPLDLVPIIEEMERFLGGSRDVLTFLAYLEEFYVSGTPQVSINTIADVRTAINEVRDLIKRSVINYYYGEEYWAKNEGYFLGQFNALGIWLPPSEQNYNAVSQQLKGSYFVQQFSNNQWLKWMEYLYNDELLLLDEELEQN